MSMLRLDPGERISVAEVADYYWFKEKDYHVDSDRVVTTESSNLFRPFSDRWRQELQLGGIKIVKYI